jgi:tetratricopeptide (TPR) repeat protein
LRCTGAFSAQILLPGLSRVLTALAVFHSEPLMFQNDLTDINEADLVIVLSVQRILEVTDLHDFLRWAQETIPQVIEIPEQMTPADVRRLVTTMAVAIWNATPLPKYNFELRPVVPAAKSRCFCGSGLRYRDCCGALSLMPGVTSEMTWEVLVHELSEAQLNTALAQNAVPKHLFVLVAERWLGDDHPRRAVTLLETLFGADKDIAALDARYEPAFDMLCSAYNFLNYGHKKELLLQRVCAEGCRQLQAAAWQQRCGMHIDERNFNAAEQAFTEALRSQPDNPNTAVLEITLLTTQNKLALAQERALFWRRSLQRTGFENELVLEFFERASTDPQAALLYTESVKSGLPLLTDLRDYLAQIGTHPLPKYRVKAKTVDVLHRRAQSAVKKLAAPADFQMRPPAPVAALQRKWEAVFPVGKPESTLLYFPPEEEEEIWEYTDWLPLFLEMPLLADSLDVLDDLATALTSYPEPALPWFHQVLLWPVLERAWAIVLQVSPPGDPREFPWALLDNQSALRLLFRRYEYQKKNNYDLPGAIVTLETMLRLNSHDNHGARAELMNQYLRGGHNELALALAQSYPNDMLADVVYGEVLVLYRLGREKEAQTVLTAALEYMPRVPHYLIRKRIKQPKLDPQGFSIGGDDQAWMYREEMLDVWTAEAGILNWLKKLVSD